MGLLDQLILQFHQRVDDDLHFVIAELIFRIGHCGHLQSIDSCSVYSVTQKGAIHYCANRARKVGMRILLLCVHWSADPDDKTEVI